MIPEHELWLHMNERALASVKRGLKELAEGKFAPDFEVDLGDEWVDELEDYEEEN